MITKRPRDRTVLIIFTDLDGTLLDSSYSFEKALPALYQIENKEIPLIICSSKTRAEIEDIRTGLRNNDPFVSENGGGIYVPKNKFSPQICETNLKRGDFANSKYHVEDNDGYYLIKLGADYADLRKALLEIKNEGFDVRGFGDMSPEEVSELTGLKLHDAKLAKERDFDETFVFRKGEGESVEALKKRIAAKGFNYTQGEYFHIMGNSDKGKAVNILKGLYETDGLKIITAAFGDSPNDIEMLNNVDRPFLVQKNDGTYNQQVLNEVKGCVKVNGIGPEGWNKAVLDLLANIK